MRIDAYTHFFPAKYFQALIDSRCRTSASACARCRRSTISTCAARWWARFPTTSRSSPSRCRRSAPGRRPTRPKASRGIANDGLKELCDKYPDQFAGFVAEVPLTAPDAGARESERAIKELGACGVQIVTNVNGKPLDRPEFEPFFAKMNAARRCRCGCIRRAPPRRRTTPTEEKSLYEIWWTFGWSYDTAAFMARMVFSKTLDKYPDLKIIVHHFGGIVPMLEGRIGPGWDQLGARTSDEDYGALLKSLKKRPLDYFKQDFYADTAVFGGEGATDRGQDVLSAGEDRVRVRLPVRSREGHDVHPRDDRG